MSELPIKEENGHKLYVAFYVVPKHLREMLNHQQWAITWPVYADQTHEDTEHRFFEYLSLLQKNDDWLPLTPKPDNTKYKIRANEITLVEISYTKEGE